MIKTLSDFQLRDFLPEALKSESDSVAIADALTPVFQYIYEKTNLLKQYDGIPDRLLDFIAYEENVDFYDTDMSITEKRALIDKSQKVHQLKGTPAAVEEIAAIFFNDAKVMEWFEYGGDPFHFKIEADDDFKDETNIAKMYRLVESVKNKRSRLEAIWFKKSNGLYFIVVKNDKLRIKPVLSFYSGMNMPGSTFVKNTSLNSSTKNGLSTVPFSGELRIGSKNDVLTGTTLSSYPSIQNQINYGDGLFDRIKSYPGQSQSAQTIDNTTISPMVQDGESTIGYCGKTYASKGE